jgi:hypothetical protein
LTPCPLKVILKSVPNYQIRTKHHELLDIVRHAQPSDDRRDDGRLAAARDDVEQHSVRAQFDFAEDFMGIHQPQERLQLVWPERSRSRHLVVILGSQELDVLLRFGL